MKKNILFAFSFTLLFNSYASGACTYYSESDSVLYAGLSLNYSHAMVNLMEKKGFERVFNHEEASLLFEVEIGQEEGRRIDRAMARLKIGDEQFEGSKTCWTEFCSVHDMAQALNRSFISASKQMKNCSKL